MRRFLLSLTTVAALGLSVGVSTDVLAGAGQGEVSAAIPEGVKVFTAEQIKTMMASKTVVIIDSRDKEKFDKEHIEGAISVPLKTFDIAQLPADKAAQLVFYCGGPSCPLAPTSAGKAIKAGYQNVAVYHEGIETWNKLNGKKS